DARPRGALAVVPTQGSRRGGDVGGRPPAGARARRRIRLHPRVAPHGRARPGRRVAGRRGRRPERRGAVARGAARGRAAQGRGARPQARRPRRGDVRRRDRGDGGGCGAARHPARGDSLSDAVRRSVPSPRRARLPRPLDRPAHDLRGLSGAASHRGRAVFQLGDLRLTAGLVIFALTYLLIAVQRLPFVHLNRPAASLVGAVAMVVFGVLTLPDAYAAVDFDVLVFLLGMMLIVGYLEVGKFFEWAARWVVRRAGTPERLLLGVVAGGGHARPAARDARPRDVPGRGSRVAGRRVPAAGRDRRGSADGARGPARSRIRDRAGGLESAAVFRVALRGDARRRAGGRRRVDRPTRSGPGRNRLYVGGRDRCERPDGRAVEPDLERPGSDPVAPYRASAAPRGAAVAGGGDELDVRWQPAAHRLDGEPDRG